jgi:hypothetical protein
VKSDEEFMMKYGHFQAPLFAVAIALLAGCGGGPTGVHAVAPGTQDNMVSAAPSSGLYTLYRATGYVSQRADQHVEPVWSARVAQGQKLGFRWVAQGNQKYDGYGALHLVAFAGDEARDMGTFDNRDVKYLWAGSNGDVTGYLAGKEGEHVAKTLTMQ